MESACPHTQALREQVLPLGRRINYYNTVIIYQLITIIIGLYNKYRITTLKHQIKLALSLV